MKWLDRDAAFRAGMALVPAILWTIMVAAGMVFLGVATHRSILSVLAAVIVIAMIVTLVQAWRERKRGRAFRRTHTWAYVHRDEEHSLKGADQYCAICRLSTRNPTIRETVPVYAFEGP